VGQFRDRREAEEELRRQNASLAALHDTALLVMNRLEIPDLLETTVRRAQDVSGAAHGFAYLVDASGSALVREVGTGFFADQAEPRAARGEGVAGRAWQEGRSLAVPDYDGWAGRSPHIPRGVIRSMIGVPLLSGGQVVGVLGLADDIASPRGLGPSQLPLLEALARLASIALDNARLFARERAAREEAERLRSAALALAATRELSETLRLVLQELRSVVPYDSASVQERRGDRMVIVGGDGFDDPGRVLGMEFPLDDPDKPLPRPGPGHPRAGDPGGRWAAHPGFRRSAHAPTQIRGWIGVPLVFGERVVGMLTLDSHLPGTYTAEHARPRRPPPSPPTPPPGPGERAPVQRRAPGAGRAATGRGRAARQRGALPRDRGGGERAHLPHRSEGRITYVNPVCHPGCWGGVRRSCAGATTSRSRARRSASPCAPPTRSRLRARVPSVYREFPVVDAAGRELWLAVSTGLLVEEGDEVARPAGGGPRRSPSASAAEEAPGQWSASSCATS